MKGEPWLGACRVAGAALLVLLLALTFHAQAYAQEAQAPAAGPAPTLTVGVRVSPPFVMKGQDGRFTGMAIELWELLAGTLGLKADYVELDTYTELVEATASGKIDVAVTNLTITKERVERIDFTHPWFDSGLRVMVNQDQSAGFGDVIGGLYASGHLRAYAWIALVILLATVLLTLFDRHFDKDFPRRWPDGIAESFYAVMSVATSGRTPARKNLFGWVGRFWQGLWLVCGVAVLAYVTSSVTSVMTTLSLTNQINSVADLPGRPVGVLTGSVGEEFARQSRLDARPYAHLDEMAEALLAGRIAAIVDDAPVLEYYAHANPDRPVAVVGPIFRPDKYGFGLPHHSELTRQLTVALVGVHESGALAELRRKYFGDGR